MDGLLDRAGSFRPELAVALEAGRQASAVILDFYHAESAETYVKGDGSPVTDADLASDRRIRDIISASFPDDAFLTEEGGADPNRVANPRCWIVDPIDGTAQFVARTGLFDVMIALVEHGEPVVAVSMQPVAGRVQAAVRNEGAWEELDGQAKPLLFTPSPEPPRVVASKWYGGREAERGAAVQRIAARLHASPPPVLDVGYQARAFSPDARQWDSFVGLPARDRHSIAQEWDFACMDLITHEAGGRLTDCWGRRHRYNKRSSSVAGGILASASADLHERVLAAVAPEIPADAPAPDPWDDGIR